MTPSILSISTSKSTERMNQSNPHQASFRDPSGYVYQKNGEFRRVIHPIYFKQYDALNESGLFRSLIDNGLLIPHEEISRTDSTIELKADTIPFITNPYEWSFEQYKHAALLTLQIQKYCLSKGFILKDASAYNVTFHNGKPIFLDTLSFDFYEEGTPWRAFKQFIMHFFGPLVLARYHGADMLKLMQNNIDGIPLKIISSLLPGKTKLNATLYTSIHLLAKLEDKHQDDYKAEKKASKLSKKAQENMLENLFNVIRKLELKEATEWGDYYDKTNYDTGSFELKKQLIRDWVLQLESKRLIDVGGNDGTFARTVADQVPHMIVTDIDERAVNQNYVIARKNNEVNMLPIVSDVLQPAPGIGFNNTERSSLLERLSEYKPDVTLALALIHHLTLSGNVPFRKSAEFFAGFSKNLIIEFPKREDSWVQSLLVRKREFINHFDFYNEQEFEKGFLELFSMEKKEVIEGTNRVLYLFKKR